MGQRLAAADHTVLRPHQLAQGVPVHRTRMGPGVRRCQHDFRGCGERDQVDLESPGDPESTPVVDGRLLTPTA